MSNNTLDNILGEMGFDSSLYNDIDQQVSPSEYKERLISSLQPILIKEFPNSIQKQRIQPHHDRISFACPYCSDSATHAHKKRGNLILQGKYANHFKCHNCGAFKRIDSFFKDFDSELKLDVINYMVDNLGDFKTDGNVKYDMSVFLDMENIEKHAIDREEFVKFFKLQEVRDSNVWGYLSARIQYQSDKFLYNPEKNYLLILNLTQNGKILGAQKRLFKGANRFESYKLSKLKEMMGVASNINSEQEEYLDTLSFIFNVCLININLPITLFEGPMDSFLFKNSLANTGATKTLPIDIPVRYWYDADETGNRKALKEINLNQEVFLWDRLIRNLELPYRNKWDLNDVMIYLKQHDLPVPLFDNYFSSDPLDAIDI